MAFEFDMEKLEQFRVTAALGGRGAESLGQAAWRGFVCGGATASRRRSGRSRNACEGFTRRWMVPIT